MFFSLFNTLSIILSLTYLSHLTYIVADSNRRKVAIAKRKKEMPAYGRFFDKLYTTRFLLIWGILAVAIIVDAFADAYKAAHPGTTSASVGLLAVSILTVVDICLLVSLWKKK
jgi:hypothetical protein